MHSQSVCQETAEGQTNRNRQTAKKTDKNQKRESVTNRTETSRQKEK